MQFGAAPWLLALLGLPVLWIASRVADRVSGRRACLLLGPAAATHREGWNPRVRSWRRFLFVNGVFWLILALARPQWGASEVTVTQRGSDVVIALDISNSMLADDEPPSRLERAKAELSSFLTDLQHSRVGLVLFAGAAFVQCPLTTDYATADIFLSMAEPNLISDQGTALASALAVSRKLLTSGREGAANAENYQAIVLVTDGEDLEGGWEREVQACRQDGITVIPVGIGKETGGLVPCFDARGNPNGFLKDADGNLVMSRYDAASLAKLAELGGADAFRIGIDGLAGERLRGVLQRLGERDFEERRISAYQDRFRWPLLLAVVSFILRGAVGARRPRLAGVARPAVGLVVMVLLAGAHDADAGPLRPDGSGLAARGRERYLAGRYEEALTDFQAARALNPDDARLSLAIGEVLHRLERYDEASAEFDRAGAQAAGTGLRAEALYNAGTTALAKGDAKRASQLLRESLQLEPDQEDALHNLEAALRQLRQQQSQPQQNPDQQKQDQQKQDQQKQDQQKQDQQNEQQQQQDQQQQQNPQQPEPQPQNPKDQPPRKEESVQPSQEELDQERAMQILRALDRDEEELKRSVQHRLHGKPKSGKQW